MYKINKTNKSKQIFDIKINDMEMKTDAIFSKKYMYNSLKKKQL